MTRSVTALVTAPVALAADAVLAPDNGMGPGDPAPAPGDVHDVAAKDLAAGELASLTSPSLFGGGGVVVIRRLRTPGKDVADEIMRYTADPAPDVFLIVTHAGGAKGKALLTSLNRHARAGHRHRLPEDHPVLGPARFRPRRVPPGGTGGG